MTKLHTKVADLVHLAGGELTGRVRLQKIVYLLDQLGLESGADYIYYHYGPYSEDLWDAVSDAKFFEGLREETSSGSRTTTYSVFRLASAREQPESMGSLSLETAKMHLRKLKTVNSTVLELASTVHWLAFVERVPDWRSEIQVRKAGKTDNGRLEKAIKLLDELQLAP